jgi:hypothetical protein
MLRASALFDYGGEALQENNIPMAEGEIFEVVEEDSNGWTRVRRLETDRKWNDEGEGYVPSSFINVLR